MKVLLAGIIDLRRKRQLQEQLGNAHHTIEERDSFEEAEKLLATDPEQDLIIAEHCEFRPTMTSALQFVEHVSQLRRIADQPPRIILFGAQITQPLVLLAIAKGVNEMPTSEQLISHLAEARII